MEHGDIAVNITIASGESIRNNPVTGAAQSIRQDIRQISFALLSPVANTGALLICLYQNMKLVRVDGATQGGTSIALNIEERTAPGSAGTDVMASDLTLNSSGVQSSSFSNDSLAKNNWLYVHISAVTGTVAIAVITLTCELV